MGSIIYSIIRKINNNNNNEKCWNGWLQFRVCECEFELWPVMFGVWKGLNNDMMRCVLKNKSSLFAPKLKASIMKMLNVLAKQEKFQLFLKQEILIQANIKQLFFISLKFESSFFSKQIV
jgi:hypothetical protein